MASAMRVFRKFRSSDGRIKIATLSGVSALVAVIALLVGVLPVMADHVEGDADADHPLVEPAFVQYGGGSGACDFAEVDSAAENELHTNNPMSQILTGTDGTKIKIDVSGDTFSFEVLTPGIGVYDVVVNGGPHNNHYDYDGELGEAVTFDKGLHAPEKKNGDLNNLSHINICYDIEPTLFVCGAAPEDAVRFGDQGLFTGATAQVFTVDGDTECEKPGLFFIEDGETTLDFGTGQGFVVTGRADFFKEFDTTDDFEPLQYDGGPTGDFEVVPWCATDGDNENAEFALDWNPGLPDGHTACKVSETEYADGAQHTVVYFEFVDPRFR